MSAEEGGADAVQITRDGGRYARVSPDGQTIDYTKPWGTTGWGTNAALWRVSSQGGPETKLACPGSQAAFFAVVQEGIYSIQLLPGGFMIVFFDFTTQQSRPIAVVEKPSAFGFSVSPDQRSILYTQLEHATADLMLVEGFQ